MAQGRFTLAYMSHDHLHGSHAGLPMIERVKWNPTNIGKVMSVSIFLRFLAQKRQKKAKMPKIENQN